MMATGIDTSLLEPEAEFAFDRSYSLIILCGLTHNIGPDRNSDKQPQLSIFISPTPESFPHNNRAK